MRPHSAPSDGDSRLQFGSQRCRRRRNRNSKFDSSRGSGRGDVDIMTMGRIAADFHQLGEYHRCQEVLLLANVSVIFRWTTASEPPFLSLWPIQPNTLMVVLWRAR